MEQFWVYYILVLFQNSMTGSKVFSKVFSGRKQQLSSNLDTIKPILAFYIFDKFYTKYI